MVGVVVLGVLAAMGVASALGLTADTRDPHYGVGPMLSRMPAQPSHHVSQTSRGRGADATEAGKPKPPARPDVDLQVRAE